MKWRIKERPWSARRFAWFPVQLVGGKDWVWLEHYWEGQMSACGGTAYYAHTDRVKLHEWCGVPAPTSPAQSHSQTKRKENDH